MRSNKEIKLKKSGFVPVHKSNYLQLGADVLESDSQIDNGATRTEKNKLFEMLV